MSVKRMKKKIVDLKPGDHFKMNGQVWRLGWSKFSAVSFDVDNPRNSALDIFDPNKEVEIVGGKSGS